MEFVVLSTLGKLGFILFIILTFAPVLIWAERRQSAKMQDRVGPVRAGFHIPLPGGKTLHLTVFGLLHSLADAMKLIWKEDFVPPKADKFLHALAPFISLVTAICVFVIIPFGDMFYPGHLGDVLTDEIIATARGTSLQVASLDMGMLVLFGIAGTGVVGAAVAGYSSDNKYALLGGIRAASQMVSYEVMLGLSLVGCFMVYNTLLPEDMVRWQQQNVWGVFVQPVAFFMYFAASIAETKRIPFDLPEAESELVAGYFTEYSGMKFGMFFMGEFIEVVTGSAILITLFFGGWSIPGLHADGIHAFGQYLPLTHLSVTLIQTGVFLIKLILMIFIQLQIRWSLVRFRYDQIMQLCWKILLPASLINILITGVLVLIDEQGLLGENLRLAVFPGYLILTILAVMAMFFVSKRSAAASKAALPPAAPAE